MKRLAATGADAAAEVCFPFDTLPMPRKAELRLPPLAKERSIDVILLLGVGVYDETIETRRMMPLPLVNENNGRMTMMVERGR
jgi:hypothetical protein